MTQRRTPVIQTLIERAEYRFAMNGTIRTYQKCPACGSPFPASKGEPITCVNRCRTQPDKFYIDVYWKKKHHKIYHDRDGRTLHYFEHAARTLASLRERIDQGTFEPADYTERSMTFENYWPLFLRDYKEGTSTRDKWDAIGKHHFLPFFGPMNLRDIIGLNIKEWWLDMRDKESRSGKPLSPKYLNDCLALLKKVFRQAWEEQILADIPRFPVHPLKVPKKAIEWLTEEEQIRVLMKIPEHDQPIFEFLFLTGVRVMEAAALHWEDVDFSKNLLTIRRTVDRRGQILDRPKDSDPRVLPLLDESGTPNQVHQLLKSLQSNKIRSISGIVFPSTVRRARRQDRTYSYEYLRSVWHQSCQIADVKQIQLKNATRHSFGMQRIGQFDIYLLAKALGHSDIRMTERYAEALPDHIRVLWKK